MPEKWTGRLIGRMHNNKITFEDLAKELGVSKPYVSMILNGRRSPDGIRGRMESAVDRIIERKNSECPGQKGDSNHESSSANCTSQI